MVSKYAPSAAFYATRLRSTGAAQSGARAQYVRLLPSLSEKIDMSNTTTCIEEPTAAVCVGPYYLETRLDALLRDAGPSRAIVLDSLGVAAVVPWDAGVGEPVEGGL
jgi:hypothetical protein